MVRPGGAEDSQTKKCVDILPNEIGGVVDFLCGPRRIFLKGPYRQTPIAKEESYGFRDQNDHGTRTLMM